MFQMIPQNFLVQIAETIGISDNELAVLQYAIQGDSLKTISSQLGSVSKEAVQKRMGEVYRKFNILGKGPGKLAKLQQKLIQKYQQFLQESAQLVESQPLLIQDIESQTLLNEISEIPAIEWQKLLAEEKVIYILIIYTLACADQPLTLETLQTRIGINADFSELLIKLGEMLKGQLIQKIVENEINKFQLEPNLQKFAIYSLNEQVRKIGNLSNLNLIETREILYQLGIAKQSIEQEQLTLICQEFSKNLNRLGYQQYQEGDLNSAKFNFRVAIKLNPDLASAHYNLGSTYEQLEAINLAKNHYEKAISLNEQRTSLAALCNLARLDILSGNFEQCLEIIEPVLDQEMETFIKSNLLKNLAWAYFLQNRYTEAKSNLEEALKLNPAKPFYHCLMAQILEAQGDTKKALTYWQNCLKYVNQDENKNEKVEGKQGAKWQPPELKMMVLQAKQRINLLTS